MRLSGTRVWAILVMCILIGSMSVAALNVETVNPQGAAEFEVFAGNQQRTVLVEQFTATNCPFCANSGPAISRLSDEYQPDEMTLIVYHVWASDPFYTTTFAARSSTFYGVDGIPTLIFDGGGPSATPTLWSIGAGAPDTSYNTYKTKINSELSILTNMLLTLTGDLTPSTLDVTATIEAVDPIMEPALMVRFVVVEDGLYALGSNGEPYHRYVARQLYEESLTIAQGETVVKTHSFTINPTWNMNKLGVVVFIQSDMRMPWTSGSYDGFNSPVLQSARLQFVNHYTLYVRDDQQTDYNTYIERSMGINGRAFKAYNELVPGENGAFDDRGTPSASVLQQYGAVIWSTGMEPTNTLDANNRNDLSTYLNGSGSLFLTGSRIGLEIGSEPFFDTYLHASVAGESIANIINGVAGDPITGAWSAASMNIQFPPSDRLDPTSGAFTTINFPGLLSAGVRADHDSDSRVVYFGVNYFQGNDQQTRKDQMLNNILNWLDGMAGPQVTLITPNGGEEYLPGEIVEIKWSGIDVEILEDGVDIFYTDTLSSPTWTPVTTSEPNDGLYYWRVPNTQSADCGIRIVIRDNDTATPDGEAITAGPCTIGTPDVSITKDVSNPTPQVSETITYTVTATNNGVRTANVTVTDTLPVEVAYVSDDGDTTGMSSYNGPSRTVTWNVIVPGLDSRVLNIVVDVASGNPGDTVWNTADFNSTDMNGGFPQSGSDQVSFQIPLIQDFIMSLTPGKHLLSIPLMLTDYSVTSVLASIAGKYSYVRAYDANDPVDPWKEYVPGRSYNSLHQITPFMGFWIEMTQGGNLVVTGAPPTTTNIVFSSAGWYLVGYPSLSTTYTISDMKTDIGLTAIAAESFDDTCPPYNLWRLPDTYYMQPGEGYWIYVSAGATWTVIG